MQYHNNILCITHAELTDGIVSKTNYDQLKYRGKINVIRRGCYGTQALIVFDTLPMDIKKACIAKYGNPRENAVEDNFLQVVVDDYKASEFFSNYILADGRFLPINVQDRYIANAKVLNAIHRIVTDRKALVKALGGVPKNLWQTLAATVADVATRTGHDLPENYRRLQTKYKLYVNRSYDGLISDKWMNRNAAKVSDIQHEALLRQLFGKHNNFDNEQIKALYNLVAENVGWDKISVATVGNYREKWNLQTHGARRGEISFDNTKAMLVKRKAPVLPLVYWTADGWEAELLYQKTTDDKKGNIVTTFHNRLTIVVVLDPCCKYPIGYAIGEQEKPELIRAAFRNAICHTEELFGTKHRVHQLQTDRYAIKNLKPMYEGLTEYFTPARAHNAKAKIIEPYFKYLNKKYCQLMYNWSGFGVTAKKESQPNAQYMNKIHHSLPDEQGLIAQLEKIMAMERMLKHDKYVAAYNELPETDRLAMSNSEYLHYLGDTTGYTNSLSAPGLVVTLLGEKREYDCFDVRFRENASTDWTIKYDPANLQKVLAINEDATLRFELTEKYIQPMALYDRKDNDSEELKLITDFNKNMKTGIMQVMKADNELVEELFLENPKLENTLTKLILTDSNGQHKDNRNAARLSTARKMLLKQNKKDIKTAEKSWQEKEQEYLNSKVNIDEYL